MHECGPGTVDREVWRWRWKAGLGCCAPTITGAPSHEGAFLCVIEDEHVRAQLSQLILV